MKEYNTREENLEMFIDLFRSIIKEYTNEAIEDYVDKHVKDRNNKEYYSIKEFGEMFGLSKNAVKGRYRRGTLEVYYDGTTPLIHRDEVERFKQKLQRQKRV